MVYDQLWNVCNLKKSTAREDKMTEQKSTIIKFTRTKNGRRLIAQTNYDALAQEGKGSFAPEIREIKDAWEAVNRYLQQHPSLTPQKPAIVTCKKTSDKRPLICG